MSSQEARSAATTDGLAPDPRWRVQSGEALRRIRELEAINAQITRHRDQLGAALRRLANYEGISTPCDNRNCSECRTAKIAREALNG